MNNRILDNYQNSDIFYIQITFYANYTEEDVWTYYA